MRLLVLLGVFLVLPAHAQQWPSKPVRVIVASSAGGTPDVAARQLSERFAVAFKGPFVVENIMGGGGLLGARTVARAAPDGHTLWMATSTHLSSNPHMYKSLPYDPTKDYDAVAALISSGFIFAVNSAVPANTVEELVAYVKKAPKKFFYATTSPRGAAGIVGEYFNHVAGIKMVQVPYKTTGLAAADTASGATQLIIISYGVIQPFVDSRHIRPIGVSSSHRHPQLPDVKTINETYRDFTLDSYLALVAPRGTPRDIVTRLNREALAYIKEPRHAAGEAYTTVGKGTPEEVDEYIRRDREVRWATMVKALKIEPQAQ